MKLKKKEIVEKFRTHNTDTGSCEVQISLITDRINRLVEHLKINKKDHSSRRGLLMLVGQRKRLMNYLQEQNFGRFESLKEALGLK